MTTPLFAKTLRDMTAVFDELLSSLSTLQSLGSIDLERLDEASLLQEALSGLVENFEVERCSIFLRQGDGLFNAAGIDWMQWAEGNNPFACSENHHQSFDPLRSLMGLAIETSEPQICHDTRTDPRFRPFSDEGSRLPLGCVISAPIRAGGPPLGVLNLSHPDPGHFNEWHERLVALYSRFLGQLLTAIRMNARLQEQVVSGSRQLEAVLQKSDWLRQDFEQLTLVDEGTGLYNRRFFFAEGRLAVARSLRHGRSLAVLLLELPPVSRAAGESSALGDIGQGLLEQIREIDLLARFDKDRLALTVAEIDHAGALVLVERLRSLLLELGGGKTTAPQIRSIGVGVGFLAAKILPGRERVSPEDSEKIFGQLIETAEAQLNLAPRQG